MRKVLIGCVAVVCIILFASAVFAGEQGAKSDSEGTYWAPWFKPSVSVGYAFEAIEPHFTFSTTETSPLNAQKMYFKLPRVSGLYAALALPFAVTDRLKLTLDGSWTMSFNNQDAKEVYNDTSSIHRYWNVDNNNGMWSTDFLASYAVLKDFSFIKDISAVAGVRWDYQSARLDKPYDPVAVSSDPSDKVNLDMYTIAPIFGFTGTFKGYKSGIFGGDMSLGFLAGPIVFGHVKFKEPFTGVTSLRADDDLGGGYIIKVFGEITALSGKITPGMDGSLSVFAQYTTSQVKGGLKMDTYLGSTLLSTQTYDFDSASGVVAIGLKAAITF
jgi:hypothetical protein